jgi:lipoprotein NlpI
LEAQLERLDAIVDKSPRSNRHRRGNVLFRLERFDEAIADFDVAAVTRRPHNENSCWERGLAQYYVGDYEGAKDQFARYHKVGARDIENGIWLFLSTAEAESIEVARETMIEYPRNARGAPFPALYALYSGEGDVESVLEEAQGEPRHVDLLRRKLFYAHYYIAKYFEALDDKKRAFTHIEKALANRIPHFMYTCAEIDAARLKTKK